MKSKMVRDVLIIAVMVIVAVGIALYAKNKGLMTKGEVAKAPVTQDAAANPHSGMMPEQGGQDLFGQWLTVALSNADVQLNEEDKTSEFIATVNGTGINRADFDKRLALKLAVLSNSAMHGQKAAETEITPEKKTEIEQQLLDQMIEEVFIQEEAKSRGVEVTDEQFEQAMTSRKEQIGGDEKFQELLKSHGISEEQMRTNLRKEMTQQNLSKVVVPEMQKMMGGGSGHGAGMMGAPGMEGGNPHGGMGAPGMEGASPHGSMGSGEEGAVANPHGNMGGAPGVDGTSPHGSMGGEAAETPEGM